MHWDNTLLSRRGVLLLQTSQPLRATSDTAIARDPLHPECRYPAASAAGQDGVLLSL